MFSNKYYNYNCKLGEYDKTSQSCTCATKQKNSFFLVVKLVTMAVILCCFVFVPDKSFGKEIPQANLESISQADLAKLESLDKPISNLVLAQAYEVGFTERGIPKDLDKAISLYKKVFESKQEPLAAYKLGMHYFTKEVKEKSNYDAEKYFIAGINQYDQNLSSLNSIMAGVVLYNKKQFDKAIWYLKDYAQKGNPTAEIYLALIYNAQNKEEFATMYLTRACTNPKSTKDIVAFCEQNATKEDLNDMFNDAKEVKSSCISN